MARSYGGGYGYGPAVAGMARSYGGGERTSAEMPPV